MASGAGTMAGASGVGHAVGGAGNLGANAGVGTGTGALIEGLMAGGKTGTKAPGNKKERLTNILMDWVLPAAGAYAASYGGGEARAANIALAYLEQNKEKREKRKLGERLVNIADQYKNAELEAQKKLYQQSKPVLDPTTDIRTPKDKELPTVPMQQPGESEEAFRKRVASQPATETPKLPDSMKKFGQDLSSFLKKTPEPVANPIYDMAGELAASGNVNEALTLLSDRQKVMDEVKMRTTELAARQAEGAAERAQRKAASEAEIALQYYKEKTTGERFDKGLAQEYQMHKDRIDFSKAELKDLNKYRNDVLNLDAQKLGVEAAATALSNTRELISSLTYSYGQGFLDLPEGKTLEDVIKPLQTKMEGFEARLSGADFVYNPGAGGVIPVGGAGTGTGTGTGTGGTGTRLGDVTKVITNPGVTVGADVATNIPPPNPSPNPQPQPAPTREAPLDPAKVEALADAVLRMVTNGADPRVAYEGLLKRGASKAEADAAVQIAIDKYKSTGERIGDFNKRVGISGGGPPSGPFG